MHERSVIHPTRRKLYHRLLLLSSRHLLSTCMLGIKNFSCYWPGSCVLHISDRALELIEVVIFHGHAPHLLTWAGQQWKRAVYITSMFALSRRLQCQKEAASWNWYALMVALTSSLGSSYNISSRCIRGRKESSDFTAQCNHARPCQGGSVHNGRSTTLFLQAQQEFIWKGGKSQQLFWNPRRNQVPFCMGLAQGVQTGTKPELRVRL